MKYFIGVIVFAVVAVGGYYAWDFYKGIERAPEEPTVEEPVITRYATSTFAIAYPDNFSLDDAYAYKGVPNKPIDGVKFTIPTAMTEGTNLADDSGVSVEWLPRANICAGDIYVLDDVSAFDVTVGSTTYSVATTSGAGAGNLYEEQVFAIPESNPCTAVRYFIHTTNLANYSPEEGESAEVREYDRAALLRAFDQIRNSLELVQ